MPHENDDNQSHESGGFWSALGSLVKWGAILFGGAVVLGFIALLVICGPMFK